MTERIRLYKKINRNLLVPELLARRSEISDGAKLLYAKLRQYEGKKGHAFPKVATLATDLAKSRRRIEAYIAELVQLGLIEVELRRSEHRPSVYAFLNHPWLFDPKPEDGSHVASDVRADVEHDVTPGPRPATDDVSAHVENAVSVEEGQREEGQENEEGHSRDSAWPNLCASADSSCRGGLGSPHHEGEAKATGPGHRPDERSRNSPGGGSEPQAETRAATRDPSKGSGSPEVITELETHYLQIAAKKTGTRPGKWGSRERKVASQLLAGHEGSDIRKAITFMFEEWSSLDIEGVPHLGLLATGWGPSIFARSQGYSPPSALNEKVGRLRAEYDGESAARSPSIGWAKKARPGNAAH